MRGKHHHTLALQPTVCARGQNRFPRCVATEQHVIANISAEGARQRQHLITRIRQRRNGAVAQSIHLRLGDIRSQVRSFGDGSAHHAGQLRRRIGTLAAIEQWITPCHQRLIGRRLLLQPLQ